MRQHSRYKPMYYYFLLLLSIYCTVDTETLKFIEYVYVTEALTCCRVVVVAMLHHCRVPSSATSCRLKSHTTRLKDTPFELNLS